MQSEQLLDPKRTILHIDRSCVPWGHRSFQRMNTRALLPRVQQLLRSTEASSAARTTCRGGLFPKPDPTRRGSCCDGFSIILPDGASLADPVTDCQPTCCQQSPEGWASRPFLLPLPCSCCCWRMRLRWEPGPSGVFDRPL